VRPIQELKQKLHRQSRSFSGARLARPPSTSVLACVQIALRNLAVFPRSIHSPFYPKIFGCLALGRVLYSRERNIDRTALRCNKVTCGLTWLQKVVINIILSASYRTLTVYIYIYKMSCETRHGASSSRSRCSPPLR
jgi:hypothetical protein